MTIDEKIESLRNLLNLQITKSNYVLTSDEVVVISKKLDRLLLEKLREDEYVVACNG